jgi:hypothetical protein
MIFRGTGEWGRPNVRKRYTYGAFVKGCDKEYLHRGQLSISTKLKGAWNFQFSMTSSSVANDEYLQRLFGRAFIHSDGVCSQEENYEENDSSDIDVNNNSNR